MHVRTLTSKKQYENTKKWIGEFKKNRDTAISPEQDVHPLLIELQANSMEYAIGILEEEAANWEKEKVFSEDEVNELVEAAYNKGFDAGSEGCGG